MSVKVSQITALLLRRLPIFLAVAVAAYFVRYVAEKKTEETPVANDTKFVMPEKVVFSRDTLREAPENKNTAPSSAWEDLPDSAFVEIKDGDKDFVFDIRYATKNNFMKKQVYPCAKVFLRKKTALALINAHKAFKNAGYFIKIYDAYRPLDVQWILWNSTNQKQYVANPRKGSNHNRGCAVDLTLVKSSDLSELNMGTEYDFFGKEAHHTYTNLPKEVLENRKFLKKILEANGFRSVSHEWWHYDFSVKYPVSNFPLPCAQ